MTTKKIPVSKMLRSAGQIAASAGITTKEAVAALEAAHKLLGYEVEIDVDLTSDSVLDFTKNEKPDFARTQPYRRP